MVVLRQSIQEANKKKFTKTLDELRAMEK